jgi:class 3 adenylate cyclase/tetratricopeptide (TPR) repeat protein
MWCGTRLEIACDTCDHLVPASAQFCAWCGSMLSRSAGQREEAGERKQATIMFADIVGSTHLIAGLDTEDVMERLRPTLAAMAQSVRRFDGSIVRNLGDGVKAAFGAPRALEGHALLACKAALAMQDAVSRLNSAPRIRVGLHSGEVVAGELDVGSAVDQEVAGMTVHLANRIEQLAEPGTICISDQCKQLVSAYCDTAELGPQVLKGYPEPVLVYRLLGLKPAVASEQFRSSELTTLCGREAELEMLQRALGEAEKGLGSAIAISAPPGVGKSRLCFEFSEWCRQRQVDVLETRALLFGHATPLQPVLEMLRSLFRISSLDKAKDARQKMRRAASALGMAKEDLVLLSEFLGIGSPLERPPDLGALSRYAQLRAVVGRVVRSAGEKIGVIIVDDLHWLDEPSADFIETLIDAVEGTHILLVLNFRPPYRARWMGRQHYRELSLSELARSDIRKVVRDLVGDDPGLDVICTHVVDRSGGNPFFAEELVRSLAENGALVGEHGSYRLGDTRREMTLPPTLEAVIGARIDRLKEREKFLLQVGSIIGTEFPRVIVEKVAALPESETKGPLDRLCEVGLIQEQPTAAGSGFAFRHPLIHEVALAMQLRPRRARLHAAVAQAIEGLEWGRLDEVAGLLAHHWEASGQRAKAAMHLQRAARWVGKTNSSQAIKDWKKVRSLIADQPHTEANDRLRALASGQILSAGWREGMLAEEAQQYAEEALRYARDIGDKMYEPMLLGSYGRILGASGAADDYVALAREALALASQTKDAGRTAALSGMLSQAYLLAGLLKEALAANDSALATISERSLEGDVTLGLSVTQLLGFDVEYWINCTRARILVGLGRFAEAAERAESLLRSMPSRADPPVTQFIPHVALTEIAWWRDDPGAARENAAKVAEFADQTAIPYLRVAALRCSGLAKNAARDFTGAAREFRDGVEFARRAKVGLEFEPQLVSELADALLRAGDVLSSAETAEEAIQISRRRAHRVAECHACVTRAAALVALGSDIQSPEPKQLLERAEQLILSTGAAAMQPRLQAVKSSVEASRP